MSEQPAAKQPTIDYSLTDEDKIIRTDHEGPLHVANYKGGVLELIPEQAKFRPAIVRFINEESGKEGATVPAIKSIILAGDKPDKVKEDVPPCPKRTMRDGDKTPAIVEWYRKYKPAEYRARYGIRGEGTVTREKTVMDEEGKPKKVHVKVEALIAERKTHLTEKPEARDGDDYAEEDGSNE